MHFLLSVVVKHVLKFKYGWCNAPKVSSYNYRLNGSSSPVLTATSLSYGKAKNLPPCRIKTPDLIEIQFGKAVDVGEGTRRAKFYANPFKGASRQMGEIYAKIFIYMCLFFLPLTHRSDLLRDFYT